MVNFGGLKNLIVNAAGSDFDAFHQISLALEIEREDLSRHSIASKIAEFADDLGIAAMRPHAEQQIVRIFRLCGQSLSEYQQSNLRRVFQHDICGTFISLNLLTNQESLESALKQGNLVLQGELNSEQKTFLEELTKNWNERLTKALKEVYLLALFSCEKVEPLVQELKNQHVSYNLPIVTSDTFYQEEQHFRDIDIVGKIFNFQKNINTLRRKLEAEIHDDSCLKQILTDVMEKPGLLFFENIKNSIEAEFECSSTLRLKLRELTKDKPKIDQILTEIIHTTASLLHQLESEITLKHKQLRPDLALIGRINLVETLMLASRTGKLSQTEKETLAANIQKQIDQDPILGTALNNAFIIDYPRVARMGNSRLALKIYQAVNRQTNKLHNISLGLEIPDLKNKLIIRPKRLEGLLLALMDKLSTLDSRSSKLQLSKAAQQAVTLVSRTFSVFDQLTNYGTVEIAPKMEFLDKQAGVMQFAKIWWLASSLEQSFKKGLLKEKFFDNIHDWLSSYNCMTNFQQPVTFTDLAGIAPLIQLIGDIYEESEAEFIDPEIISSLYKKYPKRIELLPSGLQAVFSLLSIESKNNLMYFVRTHNLIVDEPSLESLLLIKTADRKTVLDQIYKLRKQEKPLRLSLLAGV